MRKCGRAGSTRARSRRRTTGSRNIAGFGTNVSIAWETTSKLCRLNKSKASGRRSMAEENNLDLAKDPRSIIGTRVFDAPRNLVFEAFTDPKHLAEWWGPNGFTTTTHSFDLRPGGKWRFVMHGPDDRAYQNLITYDEIVPPERLIYHHRGGRDVPPVTFKAFYSLGVCRSCKSHWTRDVRP